MRWCGRRIVSLPLNIVSSDKCSCWSTCVVDSVCPLIFELQTLHALYPKKQQAQPLVDMHRITCYEVVPQLPRKEFVKFAERKYPNFTFTVLCLKFREMLVWRKSQEFKPREHDDKVQPYCVRHEASYCGPGEHVCRYSST